MKHCLKQGELAYELAGVDIERVKAYLEGKANIDEAAKKELLPFAKSAALFLLIKDKLLSIPAEEPPAEPFSGKGIGYAFAYDEFVAIRKLSPQAKPYEVAGLLSACIERLLERWYSLAHPVPKAKLSARSAPLALAKEFEGSAEEIVEKALAYKSFRPYPYLEGLVKAYPDLKPKKPRGRLPK